MSNRKPTPRGPHRWAPREGRSSNRQGPSRAPRERDINWIPRPPRNTVAQNELKSLSFVQITTLAPGSPSSIVGWLGNSVITPYWVSGVAAGTQPVLAGLNALANQYAYYRVLGYRYRLELINTGTNVVEVVLTHTNTDPAALTMTQIRTLSADGSGNDFLLASSASGAACRKILRGYKKCAAIVGKESYFVDDNYAGVTGGLLTPSTPVDQLHLTLMTLATSGNVTLTFRMEMHYVVEFYNRVPQTA